MFGQGGHWVPRWLPDEQVTEMAWLEKHIDSFWTEAQAQSREGRRGAIVVDMTTFTSEKGHPFVYCTEAKLREFGYEKALQLAARYNPVNQIIIVLHKVGGERTTYWLREVWIPAEVDQN